MRIVIATCNRQIFAELIFHLNSPVSRWKHEVFSFFMHFLLYLSRWAQNHYFKTSLFYGAETSGSIQVRENGALGDDIELERELGLKPYFGIGLTYGYQLDSGWLDFSYSKLILKGRGTFNKQYNFNGAIYSPGPVTIDKTDYRRIEFIYRYQMSGSRNSLDGFQLGAGLVIETLKFYIDGQLSPASTRFEKFEAFDRQVFPIPILVGQYGKTLGENWGYEVDVGVAYLPKFETPYKEGGSIFFEQHNLDIKAGLRYSLKSSFCGLGYQYKYFRQKGYSNEDTNEFKINTNGFYANYEVFF
jgi:hypothetical protein